LKKWQWDSNRNPVAETLVEQREYLQEEGSIQQKAITEYIRKCGYNMHFPRCLVYSSVTYGGLGFAELYVESCCNKI
jgi:hypothetical protein